MAFDLLPTRSFRKPPSTKKFRISMGPLLGFNHLQNKIDLIKNKKAMRKKENGSKIGFSKNVNR